MVRPEQVDCKSPLRSVKLWAPVVAGVRCWHEFSKGLRPLRTHVSARPASGCRASGQVLWIARVDSHWAGIAWRWAEPNDTRVVVIQNPMTIVTNLALTDDETGEPLSASQVLCVVNLAIHMLPWQESVRQAGAERESARHR